MWDNVSGKPSTFTPASHSHTSSNITITAQHAIDNNPTNNGGTQNLTVEGELVRYADALKTLNTHASNKSNPHGVTASQIGLGNVNNTADSAKSVKYATSAGSAGNVTGVVGIANGGTGQTSLAALKKQLFAWTLIGTKTGTSAIGFSNYANYSEVQICIYIGDVCVYSVIPASAIGESGSWYYIMPGFWGTFEASVYISNKSIQISSAKYHEQEKASSATISIYAR